MDSITADKENLKSLNMDDTIHTSIHYYNDEFDRTFYTGHSLSKLEKGSYTFDTLGKGAVGMKTVLKTFLEYPQEKKTVQFNEVLLPHQTERYVFIIIPKESSKFDANIVFDFGDKGIKSVLVKDTLINIPKYTGTTVTDLEVFDSKKSFELLGSNYELN